MKFLLLRGKEPTDRNPAETWYQDIQSCDDIYTLMMYHLAGDKDESQIWYWGGSRYKEYKKNVIEVRVPDYNKYSMHYLPDVIFARGGFPENDIVLKRYPKAFKIYYGAHAKRFYPTTEFTNYNLILVDSEEQLIECQKRFPHIPCEYLIKPAADNLIYAYEEQKVYDVCFPGNGKQKKFKGHEFIYSTAPSDIKILNLGNPPEGIKKPDNIRQLRCLRSVIGRYYSQCKIGVIVCNKGLDSCPRVLPEMLACNLPIVATGTFYFNEKMYINQYTGVITTPDKFWDTVRTMIANYQLFRPREHYMKHLCLEKATEHLFTAIKKYI